MFEPTGRGNEVYQIDDTTFVSFNSNPCAGFSPFANPNGRCETALKYNGVFYIVDVDARQEYLKCKTAEEAKALHTRLKEEHGKGAWSEESDTNGLPNDDDYDDDDDDEE